MSSSESSSPSRSRPSSICSSSSHPHPHYRRRSGMVVVTMMMMMMITTTTMMFLLLLPSSSASATPSSFLRGRRGLELSPPYWDDYDNDNDSLIAPSYDNGAADAARGTSSNSNNDNTEVSRKLGIVIFLVATFVSLSLIVSMVVREYYFRLYGFDICHYRCCLKFPDWMTKRRQSGRVDDDNELSSPHDNNISSNGNDGSPRQEQFDADRALALELQRQLNEEDRETHRLTKRDERRKWYEYYMKDRCVVVKDEDLFYGQEASDSPFLQVEKCQEDVTVDENVDDSNIDRDSPAIDVECEVLPLNDPSTSRNTTAPVRRNRVMSLGDSSEDDFTTDDEMDFVGGCDDGSGQKSKSQQRDHLPNICDKDDEDAHLYLKMPTDQMNKENACLFVDGECALCIDEYAAGDQVVWSDLQCRHAFHKKCIMQWLSKGKKRCPICRHWFVPGARIEDQKNEHGEAWTAALAEMENQQAGNNETSTVKVKNESTDDALTHPLDVSLAPPATGEEHRGIERGNDEYGEVSHTPTDMSSEGSAVDTPLPQRKETDCTDRTSVTMHTDESESSSSNHQSYDLVNDSSFEESATTNTNNNNNTSPVENEDA
eukprot:CAMPEP_0113487694 /NCGR_PEP_ID=MMETSP0014_2-20120614/25637_1 /TAXON_ID=2857 /ORGANISM="Nitzschia sp." /LENGTH=600 /DNA_ID=CAMNT_0000381391 /DNA_START=334 /DNA_END=2136 /DNA_ORIENTATION=- /assembly_acc=CAM_ASM_000159